MIPSRDEGIDPVELARRDQKKALPKRFYKQAGVEQAGESYALTLDGRRARTPGRNPLAVPSRALAEALAGEWNSHAEYIEPAEMPLTRLINTALDGVARELDATLAEVVKYAGSDLLCYRACEPEALAAEQTVNWDPLIDWARETLGARFVLAEGVMFVAQPPHALENVGMTVAESAGAGPAAPLRAAALNTVTTLTGSAILALALARGRIAAEEAWRLAHLDEDFQMRVWGGDGEALARRARRWREMEAAARILSAT